MKATIKKYVIEQNQSPQTWKDKLLNRPLPPPVNVYCVSVVFQLTDAEKAIIKKHDLWDIELYSRPRFWGKGELAPLPDTATVKDIIASKYNDGVFLRGFYTPAESQAFAEELETKILPTLKAYLDQSKDPEGEKTLDF